jgi:regulator of sigma E protease
MLDFLIGNDLLSAIIAFVLVLIPAVIVHELGHFLAARAVGITVLEFGVGFPPRVARLFTWRETEFTFNLIPLGGFVRPLGEDLVRPVDEATTERDRQQLVAGRKTREQWQAQDSSEEGRTVTNSGSKEGRYLSEREELEARGVTDIKAVNETKPLPRIFFMAAGALANFIFAFLVFVLIALIGIPEVVGVRAGLVELPEESPMAKIGLQAGDWIERVNGEFFDSSAELFEQLEAQIGQNVTVQVRRTTTTPAEVFEIDFVPTAELISFLRRINEYVLVTGIDEDGPGAASGLLPGDLIAEFEGEQLTEVADPVFRLQQLATEYAGQEVSLAVLRDGELLNISLVPREDPPPGTGRIGITIAPQYSTPGSTLIYVDRLQFDTIPQPVGAALEYGASQTGFIFRMIAEFPSRIIQGSTEPEERRVISIVGVSQLGGAILQDSVEEAQPGRLFEYIALISIALGITNLLPIPALDGGRILFVLVEMVRGRPISPEREGLVHLMGLIFLLSIGVLFIINDLLNPLTDIIR